MTNEMTNEDNIYTEGYTHCTRGALMLAAEEMKLDGHLLVAAESAIRDHLDTSISVPMWNDIVGRTEEEVRETLLMTAKNIRNSVKSE